MTVWLALLVAAAGGMGAVARDGVSRRAQGRWATTQPVGTVIVNVVGTALLAGLVVARQHELLMLDAVFLAGAGFCAGLTTFSTWMLEVVRLAAVGSSQRRVAVADVAGQLAVGVIVAAAILAV